MNCVLKPYADIKDIEITSTLKRESHKLSIEFNICGNLSNYLFPKEKTIQRKNELWKATCFELFLAQKDKKEYYELNISPSLAWNFYSLKSYRAEVQEVAELLHPKIKSFRGKNEYKIYFEVISKSINFELFESCNIAVILLDKSTKRNFWSLNPLGDVPDFHDRTLFMML